MKNRYKNQFKDMVVGIWVDSIILQCLTTSQYKWYLEDDVYENHLHGEPHIPWYYVFNMTHDRTIRYITQAIFKIRLL